MLKVNEQVLLLSSWLSRTEVVSTLSPLLTSQFTLLQHGDPPPWLVPGAGAGTQHHRHRVLKHGHRYQYTVQPLSYWSLSWNRAAPLRSRHPTLIQVIVGLGSPPASQTRTVLRPFSTTFMPGFWMIWGNPLGISLSETTSKLEGGEL